jgi:4-amino-4-deoxy-L-arabinose transferase-like glycosyltransferase
VIEPAVDSGPPLPPGAALAPARGPMSPTTRAWLVALLGWTVLVCFYDLAGGANFEPIDCWVAQTAREMQEAGDWLVPRFSGEIRMQKSPGPYWAVMTVSLLRGGPVSEVAARVPNAIAAVVIVLTVFWLTRRVATDRAAIFAGFATSASAFILWWSHRGASDLGLTACTTVSLAALWIAADSEPPGRKRNLLFLLGYFAAGLGMLYKMPMPLAVVGAPAVLYVLIFNRWRIFAHRIHLLGLIAFLLPWLPWAIAVTFAEDAALAKWKVEFLDRFTGDLPNVEGQGGWENLPFYLPVPIVYCLPFSLSLPMALVRAFRREPETNTRGMRFMAIWFLSLLVFFTASTGKEYRYFLPALPPLFVLLGVELAQFFSPRRPATPTLDWLGTIATWILVPGGSCAAALLVLPKWWELRGQFELAGLYAYGDVLAATVLTGVIIAVGTGLTAWLYRRRSEHVAFGALVATMYATWLYAWSGLTPYFLSQRPFMDFAQQLEERVPIDLRPHLKMVGSQDPRITWYSNIRFPRVIDQLELLEEQKERYDAGEQESLRDLKYEMRRYGEEMIELLESDAPTLFVAPLASYVEFIAAAPPALAGLDRTMPPVHLWLQTQYGNFDRRFVLFADRPPPFRAPQLELPAKVRAKLLEQGVDLTPETPTPAEAVVPLPADALTIEP